LAAGRLHRVHRGVYAMGHRWLPVEGRWMAAVLACGEGTALSNRSPATNPARTIADMRRVVSASEHRSMVRKAEVLGLRTELAPRKEPTRSDLEDLFLEFCERHGFPRPLVNQAIAGREVDFSWPALRVAVETDSYGFHRGAQALENDHERDLDLRAAGYDVVRLTWPQLTGKPNRRASAVDAALRTARHPTFGDR
jgi:hypothetical protein